MQVKREIVGVLPFKEFAILEWLWVSVDDNFSTIEWEFEALMVGGWNKLSRMDPWMTKNDVIWEVKVQDVTCCLHNCRTHLKR